MKRASAFLLCVLMILSFCACSDRKNGASSSSVAPPPAPAKSGFSTKELMLSEIPRAQAVSDDTLAAVSPGGGKWGYIGKDGSFAIEPIYLDAGDFSSGVAAVAVSDTEKGILYGYLTKDGEFASYLHPNFTSASRFSHEGIARVREGESEYFYINKNGTLAFPERIVNFGDHFYEPYVNSFSFATDFKNGTAVVIDHDPVLNKDHVFLLSCEGKAIFEFPAKYCKDDLFSVANSIRDEAGNCIVGTQSGEKVLYGLIRSDNGEEVSAPIYEELLPCSENLYAAKKDGLWGYIDHTGAVIHYFTFEDALPFYGDVAPVKYKGKWGIFGNDGAWMIEPYFDDVSSTGFSEGILAYEKDGKWGYLKSDGSVLLGQAFSSAGDFSEGVAFFQAGSSLWGLLNEKGEIILEPAFTEVHCFQRVDA